MADNIRNELAAAQDEAKTILDTNGHKPKLFTWKNIFEFFNSIPEALEMLRKEPEILIFIVLQWVVIGLAYFAWIQMLQWIPDRVWDAIQTANADNRKLTLDLINIALFAWSIFIVIVASYPISICNSAMIAVHDLRASQQKVTLTKCFAVATHHLGRIWAFTSLDAWITLSTILKRLPKKGGRTFTPMDELLYYAWKVATIAVVPALINGRDFVQAGKDSIRLLTTQPGRAIGLRLGYSAVCWIVGILAYITGIFILGASGFTMHDKHAIYNFYFIMAIPILFAVGVICILVRPIFLLGTAKFYTDSINVTAEIEKDITQTPTVGNFLSSWKTIIFLVLVIILLICLFFGNQIGLTGFIEQLATRDLSH